MMETEPNVTEIEGRIHVTLKILSKLQINKH